MKELSELVDHNTASIVNIGQETADTRARLDSKQAGSHIVAPNAPPTDAWNNGMSPKRLNLIIEGIPSDADLYLFVLELAQELGLILYKKDITTVVRLKRRDTNDPRPGPVLVGFDHRYPRDKILKTKGMLKNSMRFNEVWINADETMEIRKRKSEFRRIAYHARLVGEQVYFNHESIKINDSVFYEKDATMLREKYKVGHGNSQRPSAPERSNPPFQSGGNYQRPSAPERVSPPFQFRPQQEMPSNPPTQGDERADHDHRPQKTLKPGPDDIGNNTPPAHAATNLDARKTIPIYSLYPPTDPSVKIKLTNSGIIFSGYTAFLSNHYERPFIFEDIEHRTVDHGYCFKKAMCYERPDLADKVGSTVGPIEAKDHVKNLGPNSEWERIKAPTLKALFIAKMSQHQDLRDAMLKTAPHRLIEASWDSLWGGGAPYDSPKYDDKAFEGFNQFGDMATNHRDELIVQRRDKTV